MQLVCVAVGGLFALLALGGARPLVRRVLLAATATYATLFVLELLLGPF